MEEKSDKPTWKPKFKSEFSMGDYDFKRFNTWLERTELSSARIDSTAIPDLEMIQAFFSELNVLFKSWRSLISSTTLKSDLDTSVKDAKKQKRVWENALEQGLDFNKFAIFNLIDLLDEIHTKLLELKQAVGLGIVTRKIMSTQEKIKAGIRPKKDFGNLPEA